MKSETMPNATTARGTAPRPIFGRFHTNPPASCRRRSAVGQLRFRADVLSSELAVRIKSGSCRNFAVLMMEAARSLGLAARFVTGYPYVPEGRRSEQIGGGATHAWLEVYLPGAGWIEVDPTNGIAEGALRQEYAS
jgi:transglutaminase-like putative cysteine protease